MNYTGINRLVKSETVQKIFDKIADKTIHEFVDDWKWILTYSKKYKWYVLLYTLLGLFASTFGIASAYISAITINIITGGQKDKLGILLLLMFGTQLVFILFNAFRSRIQSNISIDVHNDIQADIFDRIIDVRWDELNQYKHGDLLNRFNEDVKAVSDNAISWIPDILINVYTFCMTFVVLYRMDHVMAWIGLASAPILIFMSRYIMRRQKKYRSKVLELNSDMMSFETETFYNMDTVKAFGVWDILSRRLHEWQKKYRKNNRDYNLFQVKANSAMYVLNMFVTMGAFCYCLYLLWHGRILYGDMTFFLNQRSTLAMRFAALVQTVPTMLNAAISTHRIREIVNLPKEDHDEAIYEAMLAKADEGLSIELKDASFAYTDGNQVYENANFIARPGEVVALMGESGAGKTTMFRLLLGLVSPEKGEVILSDQEETAVPMNADMRKLVSYVPQGNTVLLGTIAENMRMVKHDANDEEIIKALKTACAWEFVEPMGIHSEIGERGKGISEGQAQRLSIARAVLRDAPILFLDEATSALDEETEARVIDNVVRSSPNRTVIVSTHRPSVLKKCVRVYRIKGQKIVADGEICD